MSGPARAQRRGCFLKLELTPTEHSHFELVQDTVYSREETLEMIVPDACPDIVQISDTYGFCCLTRREMTDSGALLAGTVKVTVFYLPEDGGGLRRLEAELPFQHLTECSQGNSTCRLLAGASVTTAETRMMNPRKVLIRVDLRESVQIYRPATLTVCGALPTDPALGLQQQVQHYQTALALEPGEKAFTLEETLTLPGGKSGILQILRVRPSVCCTEARLIGTKLVFKGTASLELLVQTQEGALSSASFQLPLSQMMESGGAGEGASFQVVLRILDWQMGPLAADSRGVPVTLELAAQAVFYENVPIALVTDAYSITYPVSYQTEPLRLQRLSHCVTLRHPVRILVETQESVHTICDSHLELGMLQRSREGEQTVLTIPASASVLFSDEQDRYCSQGTTFSVTLPHTLPGDGTLSCSYEVIQLEALPAATGIELRGTLLVQLHVLQPFQTEGLVELELDQEHPLDHSSQPSVVLRRPGKGDTLWGIAKRYCTTMEEITCANDLEEESLSEEQMLLIPRKR